MTYEEAKEYLVEVSQSGIVLGLDTMRELLVRLDNPQEKLQFVHIAGTNGKVPLWHLSVRFYSVQAIPLAVTHLPAYLNMKNLYR